MLLFMMDGRANLFSPRLSMKDSMSLAAGQDGNSLTAFVDETPWRWSDLRFTDIFLRLISVCTRTGGFICYVSLFFSAIDIPDSHSIMG